MEFYRNTYRKTVSYYLFLLGFVAFFGALNGNFLQFALCFCLAFMLKYGLFLVEQEVKRKVRVAVLIPLVLSLPLGFLFFQRIVFIASYGGMERGDGYGSPMAFLMGMFIEWVLLVPLLVLGVGGVIKIRQHNFS